jgi:hypothetical protein
MRPIAREANMSGSIDPLAASDTRAELRAALQARQELGPDMEDQVIDAFLRRIEQRVDAQIAARIPAQPAHKSINFNPTEVVGASFGIAVPLVLFAGIFAHTAGVVAVAVMVVIVNLLYLWGARN